MQLGCRAPLKYGRFLTIARQQQSAAPCRIRFLDNAPGVEKDVDAFFMSEATHERNNNRVNSEPE
jgi:hypothetical protein